MQSGGTILDPRTPREKYLSRWSHLKNERSSWDTHWRDLSEHILPRTGRFFTTDVNKGDKRANHIIDSTGTRALRILASGLMAGMTSPARPWFQLATPDDDLNEFAPVKIWLHKTAKIMREVFARSNTYRTLHTTYTELGLYGTASSLVMQDFDTIIHHTPLTAGEYAIATDGKGNVTTLYREFEMTVGQMVTEFGLENVSQTVKNLYDSHNLDQWVTVIHAIEPRTSRDLKKRDAKNMPWKSCYFELGRDETKTLRESGFKSFRALCPRWDLTGGDIYGNSPAMECLGDIMQLQQEQTRKSEAIDYKTKPPVQVPASLKNQGADLLPGGVIYYDGAGPGSGVRTAFEVNLDISHLMADIQDVRQRINQTFYVDLFMMLANDTRSNITAREIAERHEEKLLMLGPVLERLHNELLSPLIDITFAELVESGVLPVPPEELQGMDLKVEFVSTLAQAQRAVAVGNMDRFVSSIGAAAQFKPEVLDKFDADQWVDVMAEALGVDPSLVVPDEKVVVLREQRSQQMAQMQQAEQQAQMAQTAKTASETDTEGKNALTDILAGYSGVAQ